MFKLPFPTVTALCCFVADVAVLCEAADALFVATSDLLFVSIWQQETPHTTTGEVFLAIHSKRQTDRQTARQTDRQTDRLVKLNKAANGIWVYTSLTWP